MEDEAFFLFLVWASEPYEKVDKTLGKVIRGHKHFIKRASMQKAFAPPEYGKRIPVEFDPLMRQKCWVIYATIDHEDGGVIFRNVVKPIAITDSEQEADEIKRRAEGGEWRNFLDEERNVKLLDVHKDIVLITPR